MSYLCHHDRCQAADKMIGEGEAMQCSRCGRQRAMHEACCRDHIATHHENLATVEPLPELRPSGTVFRR